jgi:predicted dehydrogenase
MFFARHKKHVLMEKPMCNCEEECLNLIQACEEEGVTLMCAYPVRFWPGVVKLKELLDSGEYGETIQMSIWTEQLTGINLDVCDPNRAWTISNRLGGGQLFSHGCHYVDILLWFLGNPVAGSHFGTKNGTPWMIKEGTSALVMKFENGIVAYHGATWGARGTRLGYDFQIQTEKGMLEYDHREGAVKLYSSNAVHIPGVIEQGAGYSVLWKREGSMSKETQYEISHFVDCCRTGKEPLTSGRKALQSLRVIWELYDAERNNRIADLRGLGLENA